MRETNENQANRTSTSIGAQATDVSVVIVAYNSAGQIRECLASVVEQRGQLSQEIIVVDNNSSDDTAAIIESEFPEVKLHAKSDNIGFAKACNFAASESDSDYLLLLNPDTVVLDKAVEKVVQFARQNPKYGYYGGRTLKEDGKTLEPSSCWDQPSLWSQLTFATGLSTLFRHNSFFDPESIGSWQRDSIREVGVITGCFLLVEKKAWQEIGGFDEHYWLYGEDVDLAYRARKAGFSPVIYPEAVVIHEVGQSSTSAQKIIWLYRGKVSLIKRNWNGLTRSLGLGLQKLGVALRALPAIVSGKKDNKWAVAWKRRSEWQDGH